MRGFKGECAHFSFNKCPIYTYDGASAKFSTNSQETDNSVGTGMSVTFFTVYTHHLIVELEIRLPELRGRDSQYIHSSVLLRVPGQPATLSIDLSANSTLREYRVHGGVL
jgi:hypothetical protein